jgi:hypothetical protein
MWAVQYNQSTSRFELTQDGFVILELETKDLDQIGKAVTMPLFTSTRKAVKVVKNVESLDYSKQDILYPSK